jgi:hypothetical protein
MYHNSPSKKILGIVVVMDDGKISFLPLREKKALT